MLTEMHRLGAARRARARRARRLRRTSTPSRTPRRASRRGRRSSSVRARFARRVGAVLVVIDTLGAFAGVVGDTENDAGAMTEALRPVQALANDGAAVLVVAHARKSAGSATDVVRGSSAIAGAARSHHRDVARPAARPRRCACCTPWAGSTRRRSTPSSSSTTPATVWQHDAAELDSRARRPSDARGHAGAARDDLRATSSGARCTGSTCRGAPAGRRERPGRADRRGRQGDPYRYGRVR